MKGFSEEQTTKLLAAGWIKGTDCGYRHHQGFVHDGSGKANLNLHYSLTHSKGGLFHLSTIRNGVGDGSKLVTIEQACSYFAVENPCA